MDNEISKGVLFDGRFIKLLYYAFLQNQQFIHNLFKIFQIFPVVAGLSKSTPFEKKLFVSITDG